MKALILAAGYGTRLYSLGKNTPKALLEIKGRPLVNYVLEKIAPLPGLDEVILATNNKFYAAFQDWAEQQTASPHPIHVVNDGTNTPEDRLGSIGDIDFVLKKRAVEEDMLVVGGDNLFDDDLGAYIGFALKKSPSVTIGLYDIADTQEAGKFGVVELDAQRRLISFEEKPAQPQSTLVAMCLYFFPRESLGFIADYLAESKTCDTTGDYIRWLHKGKDVYGFQFSGKWYDIGSVETYKQAQEKFQSPG
jgi:glucose-1-phosphate thymidylyltransferase